jgi:ribonuclease Y
MNLLIPFLAGFIALAVGSVLGYFARQSIAQKQVGTLEAKIQKRTQEAKTKVEAFLAEAKNKGLKIIEGAKKEEDQKRKQTLRTEQILLRREDLFEKKSGDFEIKEKEFRNKVEQLREVKESIETLKKESLKKLETISGLSKEGAKKELLSITEKEYQLEILEKLRKLEREGRERFDKKAKEIVALAIQKCAISQAQELTTTTVALPSDDIKGRIIGKEGRNIKTLEKLTGCEIVVDDTPEAVTISGFDPIRRHIAKISLERLVQDGRIQPGRIEDIVAKTENEIVSQIKEAGETAVFETGVLGLDPKIIQLLGRLRFRTSYGQNVLLHSIEVSFLAEALAAELGANVQVAKKAGLLHDIGKAIDHQVQGSHVDIGIKILEKFGCEKEVIDAMKSHHEEYPYESIEAILVQTADAISGARPGARKDTLENYLKRLEELENIATSFAGVNKAYAIQAGREIRVFVKPEAVDDLGCRKLAREVADRIQQELRYPGEIKVNVIRENRVIEYAK